MLGEKQNDKSHFPLKYCCFCRITLIEGRRRPRRMLTVAATPWKTQLFFLTQQMLSQTNYHMEIFYYFLIIRWACENCMLIESGKSPANKIHGILRLEKALAFWNHVTWDRNNDSDSGFCDLPPGDSQKNKEGRGAGGERAIVSRK